MENLNNVALKVGLRLAFVKNDAPLRTERQLSLCVLQVEEVYSRGALFQKRRLKVGISIFHFLLILEASSSGKVWQASTQFSQCAKPQSVANYLGLALSQLSSTATG